MKKILSILLGLILVLVFSGQAYAAGKAAPKTTGGVGYDIGDGLQRYANFSAIATSKTCSYADVTGSYVFTFMLDGDALSTYPHDANLTQTGTTVDGNGGYLAGSPYTYAWDVTGGTVSGNTINLTMIYTAGATGTIMTMVGNIASDGTMAGTWSDNYGGARNGTWSSTTGNATVMAGCTGKSTFNYSDANGTYYTVSVQYVKVLGTEAWFAGPVVSGNTLIGSWLFVKVKDNGEPGKGVDQIWGDVVSESAAKAGVALMSTPGLGPIIINSGNLKVH